MLLIVGGQCAPRATIHSSLSTVIESSAAKMSNWRIECRLRTVRSGDDSVKAFDVDDITDQSQLRTKYSWFLVSRSAAHAIGT